MRQLPLFPSLQDKTIDDLIKIPNIDELFEAFYKYLTEAKLPLTTYYIVGEDWLRTCERTTD